MDMSQNYMQYTTTVGSNRTATMSLLDAETGGMPRLIAGPGTRINNVRFYLRMPEEKECDQFPAPMGFDRRSITFEPFVLFIQGALPFNTTCKFYRITSPDGNGKINKLEIHKWTNLPETATYPGISIQVPSLRPNQIIEIEGASAWRKSKYFHQETAPIIQTYIPVSILALVKMKWIPLQNKKRSIEIVRGDPILHPHSPVMDADPILQDAEDLARSIAEASLDLHDNRTS
jgi:hypothetical protein